MMSAKEMTTTGPAMGDKKKKKAGKAARAIGEVDVAVDEKAADELRTAAPTVGAQATLVAVEERQEADAAIAEMLEGIENCGL